MFEHLLIPLDGSSLAECVLPHGLAMARVLGARLTLLQVVEQPKAGAGTRALNYGCSNGNCGECKARLVSGHLAPGCVPDYQFSAAEKAANYFLACHACTLEDLEIEVHEAGSADDMPLQHIETRVAKLEHSHPDVMVVHLRTPRSQSLRFLAGQHATLEIPGLPPRNKSIASCPCHAMNLQFHIRRAPGDPFAEYCFSALKPNQAVMLTGPSGRSTFDDEATRQSFSLLPTPVSRPSRA